MWSGHCIWMNKGRIGMKKLRIISLLLTVVILLSACGQNQPPVSGPAVSAEETVRQAWLSMAWFHGIEPLPPVEHGEDYVIEWVDAGMEAHIRFLLDKPDGDIYHSDVWDIGALRIANNSIVCGIPLSQIDIMDKEPLFYDQAMYRLHDGTLPMVASMADLRHFDNLQALSVGNNRIRGTVFDLDGIQLCENLKILDLGDAQLVSAQQLGECEKLEVLELSDIPLDSLEPLMPLTELKWLWLMKVGTVDLSALENMENLVSLRLMGNEILSLEPLTALPNLKFLDIGNDVTLPSLEPLTQTRIEYLDFGLSVYGRDMYRDLDYEPLTRMSALIWLDMTNHTRVDSAFLVSILNCCPDLKYLRIKYTSAADEIAKGKVTIDISHLEAFDCTPN